MDLLDDDSPSPNAPEFTVSEISGAVKKTLEGAFGRIRVRGEIGRVMKAGSGHMYYDLKDDRNVISCNTWKGQVAGLGTLPEEGLEVIVTGKVSSFGGQSRYNINVDTIEVAGEGALMALLEKRKKAMQAEGLFAEERKKPLPYLPEIIGVVTSPQGAVIRDILHRLRDRFPRKVLIWPVAVQGKDSAPQVTAAINGFNALTPGGALPRPDLLIVARGGGSIEDLWGFNEEIVARAAAASDIPLISAVGHETDTTLIDFVSDRRAPTPTAAAEMAVPVRLDLMAALDGYDSRLTRALSTQIGRRGDRLRDLSRALPRADELTARAEQRLDAVAARLPAALKGASQVKRVEFERRAAPLRPSILTQKTDRMKAQLDRASDRLGSALQRRAAQARAKLDQLRLQPAGLSREISGQRDRLTRATRAASNAATRQIGAWHDELARLDRLRETLGYQATLDRGYAVVWDGEAIVTSKKAAKSADALEVQFKDGRFAMGATPAKPKKPKPQPPEQTSLFED
ncbi:exodeoxyribonuclease VII large subunit [uncultured Litoreibacter sp.]|uniref:exodeoxyribonuclease VII large subunit n=1 Tax=uncultured Litoreibacter sp. TaxID=1392394 RepID=UPI002636DC9A|nr:exodeoxyribonuclease VII large subunit [uncultured Litoreibacter sp.]